MNKAPKIGARVKLKPGHRYYPCDGTVEKIWPKRICLNWDELASDDDAEPRYGGPAPERDWQITMRVDQLPKDWAYTGSDVFCPSVSEIEPL